MTSKILYPKYIRENINQRSYLFAMAAVGMLLLLPINLSMNVVHKKMYGIDLLEWARSNLYKLINGQNNALMVLFIILLGILCATSGFSYLHSKVKQDFFHSMPLSRPKWFMISYFGGLMIFIVPYVFFTFCALLVGQMYALVNLQILKDCMLSLLSGIFMFLLIYHTMILAMMLTGRTGTGILAGLVLFFYINAPLWLYTSFASVFFKTWSRESETTLLDKNITRYFTPSFIFANMLHIRKITLGIVSGLIFILAVTFVVSLLLVKKYPAESAKNALAFKKSGPVVKFMITVPLSLGATLFINSIFYEFDFRNSIWWFINAALSALIINFVIEFIYTHDLRMIFRGKISAVLSLFVVLFVILVFRFDLFGYDSFIPKEEKLKDMSVYNDNFNIYFDYYFYVDRSEALRKTLKSKNLKPLYELAKTGVCYKALSGNSECLPLDKPVNVTICYGKKNGGNVYRDYVVDTDLLVDTLTLLCKDEDYKRALIPILLLDPNQIQEIFVRDIRGTSTQLSLTREQRMKLMDGYLKDVHDASIRQLSYDGPLAEMSVTYHDLLKTGESKENDLLVYQTIRSKIAEPRSELWDITKLFIYDSYARTLGLLTEFGYPVCTGIPPEEVEHMFYHKSEKFSKEPDTSKGTGTKEEITDSAKMRELLDRINPYMTGGLIGMIGSSDEWIDVTLKGNNSLTYYLK